MPDVKEKKDEFDKILDLVFKKTGLPRQFTELRKLFQNLLIKVYKIHRFNIYVFGKKNFL